MDHVLHTVVNLDQATNSTINVSGANTAELVLDSTTADGAVLEDVYLISRGTAEYTVNLFLSSANDYLRPNQGRYIGSVKSAVTVGALTSLVLPKTLTPVPQVGDDSFNRALYIPKGMALWAARDSAGNDNINDGPNLAIQGGWY